MSELWHSARLSARTALEAGDLGSAVSRAYYAMFDVARAVLSKIDPELTDAKTHATIPRRFSEHVVRTLGLDRELAHSLRRAFETRLQVEYDVQVSISVDGATRLVDDMEKFVAALSHLEDTSTP